MAQFHPTKEKNSSKWFFFLLNIQPEIDDYYFLVIWCSNSKSLVKLLVSTVCISYFGLELCDGGYWSTKLTRIKDICRIIHPFPSTWLTKMLCQQINLKQLLFRCKLLTVKASSSSALLLVTLHDLEEHRVYNAGWRYVCLFPFPSKMTNLIHVGTSFVFFSFLIIITFLFLACVLFVEIFCYPSQFP